MLRAETLSALAERDKALQEVLKGREVIDLYDSLGHGTLASELIQLLHDLHQESSPGDSNINLLTGDSKLVVGTEPPDMPDNLRCIGVAVSLDLENLELAVYACSEGGIYRMLYIDQHWNPIVMWDMIETPGSKPQMTESTPGVD